jgi:hypothetical protein
MEDTRKREGLQQLCATASRISRVVDSRGRWESRGERGHLELDGAPAAVTFSSAAGSLSAPFSLPAVVVDDRPAGGVPLRRARRRRGLPYLAPSRRTPTTPSSAASA